ncbi:hypothetical protein [Chondrinema litorale]|uniref:hypothetical protein n=1 Tax=Chondrinema litorale TaxID=2994555 RepID=UPI002543834D|nr:hypothetical protein [Chondrinema litorale]UZR97438.1 hypothetical protein OQ292_26890 [Chondrinema litorale]
MDIPHFELPLPDLEVEINYLTRKESGRTGPVFTGYCGQFYYDGFDWDAPQQFLDEEICFLGETIRAYVQFMSPKQHIGKFYVGKIFKVREGAKTVGIGKILKILREDFKLWEVEKEIEKLENKNSYQPISPLVNVKGIITNFKKSLKHHNDFKYLGFKSTKEKNCLLELTCSLQSSSTNIEDLLPKFRKFWMDEISMKNEMHKIQFSEDKVELEFLTWDTSYCTGKIILIKN